MTWIAARHGAGVVASGTISAYVFQQRCRYGAFHIAIHID